jgi:hypothetical protein
MLWPIVPRYGHSTRIRTWNAAGDVFPTLKRGKAGTENELMIFWTFSLLTVSLKSSIDHALHQFREITSPHEIPSLLACEPPTTTTGS